MLIALYERVTRTTPRSIGINAYHNLASNAGKKAAGGVIALKAKNSRPH